MRNSTGPLTLPADSQEPALRQPPRESALSRSPSFSTANEHRLRLWRVVAQGAGGASTEHGPAFDELLAADLAPRVTLFQQADGRSSRGRGAVAHLPDKEHDQRDQQDPEGRAHESPDDREAAGGEGNRRHGADRRPLGSRPNSAAKISPRPYPSSAIRIAGSAVGPWAALPRGP